MRFNYYLKKRWFWIFLLFFGFVGRMGTGYFGESISKYIEQVVQEYSQNTITKAIAPEIIEIMEGESIMTQISNSNGNVVYSYIDAQKANVISTRTSANVVEAMEHLNTHEDFQEILLPFGYFFSRNVFLTNVIQVPISLQIAGSHKTDIKTAVSSYGINSSLVEIYLEVRVEVQIIIPFVSKKIETVSKVPLSIEVINGEVPKYYVQGGDYIPGFVVDELN